MKFTHAPAFSFPKKETKYLSKASPGPGYYDPIFSADSPKYSISKNFQQGKQNTIPGPGSYDPSSNSQGQSHIFSKQKRIEDINTDNPGPGNYNVTKGINLIKLNHPKHSFMQGRRSDEINRNLPGPGQYESKQYFGKEGPSAIMSSSDNSGIEDPITPGPGYYNTPNLDMYKMRYPSAKMIGKPKDDYCKSSSTLDKSKEIGPGKYDIEKRNQIENREPSWKFNLSKRIPSELNENPGVGSYCINKPFGSTAKKIIFSGKNYNESPNMNPGPGYYNVKIPDKIKNPAWKIPSSSNILSNSSNDLPGPGYYNIVDLSRYKKREPSVGKFATNSREVLSQSSIVGPGDYNLDNKKYIEPHSPSYKFSISPRDPTSKKITTPDSGHYSNKSNGNGYQKIPIGGKGSNNINNIPGPGYYDVQRSDLERVPSWKIGKSKRGGFEGDDSRVGPGSYNIGDEIKGSRSPKYSFSVGRRFQEDRKDGPGPGFYKVRCCFDDINEYTRESGKFDNNFKYV